MVRVRGFIDETIYPMKALMKMYHNQYRKVHQLIIKKEISTFC